MAEVGTAFVSIVPSAKGFGAALNGQVGTAAATAGSSGGKRFGGTFTSAAGAAVKGLVGVFAVGAITQGLRSVIAEAREAQKVGAKTAQIIKATGGAAKISAEEVSKLAEAIGRKTAVDDETIQSGANMLLTFKKVRNEVGKGAAIFDRATQAAVDLASVDGMGSVVSTSKMLGKALNDPIKGLTALNRAGVQFTEQQKEQIKTLVESGNVLGAQKIILAEVESQVGGVAAASATAGDKMAFAWNQSKEAVGKALLPALDRVATFIVSSLLPAIGRGSRAIKDFFTKGTSGQATTKAFGVIRDAAGKIADGFRDAIGKVEEFRDKLGGIDFSKLDNLDGKKLGEALVKAFTVAIESLGSLSTKLVDGVSKVLGGVDWLGLGIKIGTRALPFALGLATGIINGITDPNTWKQIWTHLPAILLAAVGIALAPAKIVGGVARILGRIPLVGTFFAWILRGLSGLGTQVKGALGKFFRVVGRGFLDGFGKIRFPSLLPKFLAAIRLIPTRAGVFLINLGQRMLRGGFAAGRALGSGLRNAIGFILATVGRIVSGIVRAVGRLVALLVRAGRNAAAGLARGLISGAGAIFRAAANIARRVASTIKNALSIRSPSKVMMSLGADVTEGLRLGIAGGESNVASTMSSMARTIASVRPHSSVALAGAGASPLVAELVDPTIRVEKDGLVRLVDTRVRLSNEAGAMTARFARP